MANPESTAAGSGADQRQEAPAQNGAGPAEAPAPGTIERIQPKPLSLRDPGQLARAYAESGYWKDVKSAAQAVVKIAAGEELGLTPLAAMQGMTIIEGKIGFTGNLIAQLIRRHDRYGYKIVERTDESCTLQFLEDGEPIDDADEGKVTFSVEDARRAELVKPHSNWAKYPRAMCFNRALTEGCRLYFPDLTLGTPVYSDEEIREIVHVDSTVEPVAEEAPAGLDPEKVDHLYSLIESVQPALDQEGVNWHDGLCVRLGALGIDAPGPRVELRDHLATLTLEQFEMLDADLQGLVESEAAEAGQDGGEAEEVTDAEVVGEEQEGGGADA